MKTITILFLALGAIAARAQTTGQSQIRHIETSLNHLTVLEFGESVTTLAIADPDSFQVERHDDRRRDPRDRRVCGAEVDPHRWCHRAPR